MASRDFQKIFFVSVNHANPKKGILTSNRIMEMSIENNSLNNIAIPVAPPSRNPLGSKNALRPILASRMPMAICMHSKSKFFRDVDI